MTCTFKKMQLEGTHSPVLKSTPSPSHGLKNLYSLAFSTLFVFFNTVSISPGSNMNTTNFGPKRRATIR